MNNLHVIIISLTQKQWHDFRKKINFHHLIIFNLNVLKKRYDEMILLKKASKIYIK